MDDPRDREILAYFPYVVVRIGCDRCTRKGVYRLARLAAKFGADVTLDQLISKLVAAECPFWKTRHLYHGTCHARFVDLDAFRDDPTCRPRFSNCRRWQELLRCSRNAPAMRA